ncbi:DUF4238 domain-containing protein [Salinisphaera hydrothermalis]|uniref:DUF4238 domain-containing protein n=1 Tax=Salinisphaera hydrothermalis TaxID=563188 RepID=UPI003340CE0E
MRREGLAKNQHYVPRFILKRFVERKEQIWVYDKHLNRKFKTNIKNVAAESGFYDFQIKGHEVTFEISIGKVEGSVSSILKKIINGESLSVITDDQRLVLANFFALQFVRTPQWRHMWDGMHNSLASSLRDRGIDPEDIEGYEEASDENTKLAHMRQIFDYGEYAPHFYDKIWVLLKTNKNNPFWLSDNPISLQNMNDFGFYGNIGLAVKGIEIYFPISNTLCIGMWCRSHEEQFNEMYEKYRHLKQVAPWMVAKLVDDPNNIESLKAGIETGRPIPSKQENVINHNSLQVKYSSRFVFSNSPDFSLAEQMLEAHPCLREGPKIKVS